MKSIHFFSNVIDSTIRSFEVSFFKNVRGLNKNRDKFVKQRAFLLFHGCLGAFGANSNKNMQLSLENCLLERPGLAIVELLCKKIAQKMYQKRPKIVRKKLKTLSFSSFWFILYKLSTIK